MSNRSPALEARSVSIGYKESRRSVADNLSLKLESGEFVSLLGPNGVGKSTLIRTLAGIDEPKGGEILLNGYRLLDMAPKERARRVSVVLTDSLPGTMLSVYSLVALGRHPYTGLAGRLSTDDRARVDWAIDTMGIQNLATRRFGEISDGEKQKALIARALAQEAKVLLLDEPTAFVDLPRRVEIVNILRELAHYQELAVLASSHDLELSLSCADKLWLMDSEGSLTTGIPEDLALRGSIAKLFSGDFFQWDSESGGFQVRGKPGRFVRITGQGEAFHWARRALERIGFGSRHSEKAELEITVSSDANGDPLYQAVFSGLPKSFTRLEDLIGWIRGTEKSDTLL
jgi:iron complex transport system ATP-binding protein